MKIRYFVLFFVALGLAGCGNSQSTSHPTAIPTIRFAPTFTPAATPTSTNSPLPVPSRTPAPSSTPTQSATPMPSQTADLTQAAFETYHAPTQVAEDTSVPLTEEARATIKATFPESCGALYPFVSPDGNWLAEDCSDFHVVRRDGQKKIVITHEELTPPDSNLQLDVIPSYWSKDSQYLYFTMRFCCADTDAYGSGNTLYRLDMQSSTRIKIIDGDFFNYYDFSPTGRRLLHIPNDVAGSGKPIKFHLIDLKSGEEQWLSLENFEQAYVNEWSTDGTRFIITAKIGNFYEENSQYALFLVSLNDKSFTQLIPLSAHDVYATDWSADDVLTVQDCNYDASYEICKSYPYDLKAVPHFSFPTARP